MLDQSRQSRINHDTAQMLRAYGRQRRIIQCMTHAEYASRHERRPAWQRADTWWTVAIVVGLFVAGAVAGAITQ